MNRDEKLFGSLRILSENDVEKIFAAAVHTLETVGVAFEDPGARERLQAAGASVAGDRVRLPEPLVTTALSASPKRVMLGARMPENSIELGLHRFVTTNGFGTTHVLDSFGGMRREAVAQDMARLTRISDHLEQVGFCQHLVTPADLPQELLDVALPCIVLSNTSKHCHLSSYSARYVDEVFALGEIARDETARDDPVYSLGCCSVSPLRFPAEATILLRKAAGRRIPFLVVSGAVGGVMSPVTLAGSLVVQTAELLAASTLAQTVEPAAPIAWGSFSSPMDPRTSRQRLGTAELSLLNGATAQICRRCGVPFGYGTGGITDASSIGVQTGIEKALTTLSAALAGVEVIHDAVSGIMDSGLTVSYEQLVIDDETCQIVRRLLRGIEVDEERLALAAIEEAGPGGSYLALRHTAEHFRDELHLSDFWEKDRDASESVLERARARSQELAEKRPRSPLSGGQAEAMLRVWKDAGLPETMGRKVIGVL